MITKPSPFLVSLLTSSHLFYPQVTVQSILVTPCRMFELAAGASPRRCGETVGNAILGLIPKLLTETWPLVMVSGVSGAKHGGKWLVLQMYPEHSMLESG